MKWGVSTKSESGTACLANIQRHGWQEEEPCWQGKSKRYPLKMFKGGLQKANNTIFLKEGKSI